MDKYEEYKFFAESTQRLTDRRLAASQTFMSVNTVVFGVLSFVLNGAVTKNWGRIALSLPLFAVGALACLLWHHTIAQYRTLIGWRYDELMAMEREDAMRGSHQFYLKEWEHFYGIPKPKSHFGFSRVEVWLPRLFIAVYAIYLVSLVIITAVVGR